MNTTNIVDNNPITIEELAVRIPRLIILDSLEEFWQVGAAINLTEIIKLDPQEKWIDRINYFLGKASEQFNTMLPSTEMDLVHLADMTLHWLQCPEEFEIYKEERDGRIPLSELFEQEYYSGKA